MHKSYFFNSVHEKEYAQDVMNVESVASCPSVWIFGCGDAWLALQVVVPLFTFVQLAPHEA